MRHKLGLGLLVLALNFSQINNADAVLNGVEQTDKKWVVALTINTGKQVLLCSGVLIKETTVMTAKHCVVDKKAKPFPKIIINSPGERFYSPSIPEIEQREVTKVVFKISRKNFNFPDDGDIAFLRFAKPFSSYELPEIATLEQINTLKPWSVIKGYGYGTSGIDGKPYSVLPNQYDLSWGNDDHAVFGNIVIIASATSIGCSGDSGGPITAFLSDNREVLIGIASTITNQGANGCANRELNQLYFENFNFVYPFLKILDEPDKKPKGKKLNSKSR